MYKGAVLFLQGPLGNFFKQLADEFSQSGYTTHKINFNAGDALFSGADNVVNYTHSPESWADYLADYLRRYEITSVFVMGDCRYYHEMARVVCRQMGVSFMVFEEGYLRPNTITLEKGGVNARSSLIVTPESLQSVAVQLKVQKKEVVMGPTMKKRAVAASLYYMAAFLGRFQFPHYRHHRAFNPLVEGACWCRGGFRKVIYKLKDRHVSDRLKEELSGRFFLVPLQVHDDSQMTAHSPYTSVEAFITEVVESFAQHAPADQYLVFKHHPMDRGYTHYGKHIRQLAQLNNIQERVLYCHDVHLPSLYNHMRGVVSVNSTVALSALLHHVPVSLTGKTFYSRSGLLSDQTLATFWREPGEVNRERFNQLRTLILEQTQINGSFFNHSALTCKNVRLFYENKLMPMADRPSATHSPAEVDGVKESESWVMA